MNTTGKWLIVGGVLFLVGALVTFIGLAVIKFDWVRLDTTDYESKDYDVTGDFRKITVEGTTDDVAVHPSKGNTCKVVCMEDRYTTHEVSAENGTLRIKQIVNGHPFFQIHLGVALKGPGIDIYVPESEYEKLEVTCTTGDVQLTEGISFDNLAVNVVTGDVRMKDFVCKGKAEINVRTGDLSVKDSSFGALSFRATTGDLEADESVVEGDLHVNVTTGDVDLDEFDAANLYIKTTTGDVKAELLSGKEFVTQTGVGDVEVPEGSSGGKCEVTTTTGDINIKVR